jgi:trehalose 6-phosphate phosphatase
MTGPERSALARIVDSYWRGVNLALLFDFDGTLVPIEDHPRVVELDYDMRRRLEKLARTPTVSVGILSGRRIDELKNVIGLSGVYYVGTGGLELDLCGQLAVHPKATRAAQLVVSVADRLRRVLAGYPGAWVEQKPIGLTVHYRDVATPGIGPLQASVARTIEPFFPALSVMDGTSAIEIVPDLGWTKGSALRMIVNHIGATTVLPVYAGDDANDADALSAAAALDGVTIGIGPRAPSIAHHRLPDPSSLGSFLDELLTMLQAGHTRGMGERKRVDLRARE